MEVLLNVLGVANAWIGDLVLFSWGLERYGTLVVFGFCKDFGKVLVFDLILCVSF